MDTFSAYNTYQIIYNPVNLDRVGIFVDGIKVANALRSQVPDYYPPLHVWFGAGGSTPVGEGNWNYVAFEIGQHPIPLPSTFLLLGSGLLGLVGWRRFRKS